MLIGEKVHNLPSCHSTNDYLKDLLTEEKVLSGTVVTTNHQTAGKGQRGNSWESNKGENLTFSFYLEPLGITPANQFGLNYFVTLSIYSFLSHVLLDSSYLKIKWPNDIYVGDKKIGGILIENQIIANQVVSAVVGVGLNLNQSKFNIPTATSVAIINNDTYDLKEALGMLFHFLNRYVRRLDRISDLKKEYFTHLLGYESVRKFLDQKSGKEFMGKIVDVSESGMLILKTQDLELKEFDLKEVKFIF